MVSLKKVGSEVTFTLGIVAVQTRLQNTGKMVMTNLRHLLHQLHRKHSPQAWPKICIPRGQQSLGRLRTPTINWPTTIHGLRMDHELGASCCCVLLNSTCLTLAFIVFLLLPALHSLCCFPALTCFHFVICFPALNTLVVDAMLFIYFLLHP